MRVVVSEGPVIANPINGGGANPLCANAPQMAPAAPENIRMVGLSITYNNFKFASLGDLDWSREMEATGCSGVHLQVFRHVDSATEATRTGFLRLVTA